MNNHKHSENNTSIIEILNTIDNHDNLNAKYLSDNNIPIWIRQVLIPGYTDDKNDLLKLKDFINSLKTVQKIEILPYHSAGEFKWKN